MKLQQALDNLKHDTRMADWNFKQGLLTPEEQTANNAQLKDMAADCEEVTLEDRGDFED